MGSDFAKLENFLANGDFTADQLREAVTGIEVLRPYRPGDPFPLGTPKPDAFRVRVLTKPEQLSQLAGDLLTEGLPVRSWRVFPIGIVVPDSFAVDIDIGKRFG
jgi:hypothetical protein